MCVDTYESKNCSNFYCKIGTTKFCSIGKIAPLSPALLPGSKYPDRPLLLWGPCRLVCNGIMEHDQRKRRGRARAKSLHKIKVQCTIRTKCTVNRLHSNHMWSRNTIALMLPRVQQSCRRCASLGLPSILFTWKTSNPETLLKMRISRLNSHWAKPFRRYHSRMDSIKNNEIFS